MAIVELYAFKHIVSFIQSDVDLPQVTGLQASTNNRSSTVLSLFLEATKRFGEPSHVRGDRGGENVDVSVWMIMRKGPNRGSFIWGS